MNRFNSLYDGEPLFLVPRHREIILELLRKHVPEKPVWAFGSRATGKHVWRFSDLDLAAEVVGSETRCNLREAFSESELPIKVDFLELCEVDPKFVERIRPDFVLLQSGD